MFESQVSRRNCQTFSTGFTPELIRGGAFGRLRRQRDIGGHGKRRRGVPARLTEAQHGMGAASELRRHRCGGARRHDEARGLARHHAPGPATRISGWLRPSSEAVTNLGTMRPDKSGALRVRPPLLRRHLHRLVAQGMCQMHQHFLRADLQEIHPLFRPVRQYPGTMP